MIISPESNSLEFFGLNVRYYGITMFFALLCAGLFANWIANKFYENKISTDFLLDLFPIIVLSGILGARIYYVILSLPYYFAHPMEIFAIWHGGLSIHGGIIFGTLAGFLYCVKHKKNALVAADAIAPSIALGQAIGRWGNFFNSEAFGYPTELPWKLYIAPYNRPMKYLGYDYFHPTFLYESLMDLFVCVLLLFLVKKTHKGASGYVFFSYLVLYSFVRIFVESLRIDSVLNLNFIPVAQIASIFVLLTGILGIIIVRKYDSRL